MVGAHSVSEVLAGLLLGAAVSAVALTMVRLPRALFAPIVPVAVVLWLTLMPVHAPASRTHSMVTRLSLSLSGHKTPYTRNDMLRKLRQQPSEPSEAQGTLRPSRLSLTERTHNNGAEDFPNGAPGTCGISAS
jgi:hypothetical protein